MIWLSKEKIVELHSRLIGVTSGLDGIRDENMLDSATAAPFQTFDSVELFPSVVAKATRLAYGLTSNHPFFDGNKRTGAHLLLLVLLLNDIELTYTQDELASIFYSVAFGKGTYEDLHHWTVAHIAARQSKNIL